MAIVLVLTITLLILGILENAIHQRRVKQIPIRIHVNGTRGKSTTTRLIAGILRQAGYRVIAKTTGTAARLILEDGTEVPIQRKRTPSIAEQIKVVAEAARRRADVLVIECMAINPEMQWVSEQRIVQSTIGVITNVREDHLDEMGTTRKDVASVLALAIPKQARLVVGEEEFFEFFQEEARKLGTSSILAEANSISHKDLDSFPYMMFKGNVACALKVGELLGIPENLAWKGMQNVTPDPGSTQIYRLKWSGVNVFFVNALAANDFTSTLLVWERWQAMADKLSLSRIPVVGLLHNRADRSFRVEELVQIALELPLDALWLTGDLVPVTKRYLKRHGFDLKKVASRKRESPQLILNAVSEHYTGDVVLFAYGNIKGFGEELADYFDRNGERVDYDLRSDRIGISF